MNCLLNGISNGPGIEWPNTCRIAVMLTFNFEAETLRASSLMRQGKQPDELDQGRYGGKDGVWRCLRMLETYGVKATFFTPSDVLEAYPEAAEAICRAGHEIAYHGVAHEPQRDTSRAAAISMPGTILSQEPSSTRPSKRLIWAMDSMELAISSREGRM